MANSSILGGTRAPAHAAGKDAASLGPSDSSDSGSDALGELGPEQLNSDSDRSGTGERASANPRSGAAATDVAPDHIEQVSDDALDTAVSLDEVGTEIVGELAVDDDVEATDEEESAG